MNPPHLCSHTIANCIVMVYQLHRHVIHKCINVAVWKDYLLPKWKTRNRQFFYIFSLNGKCTRTRTIIFEHVYNTSYYVCILHVSVIHTIFFKSSKNLWNLYLLMLNIHNIFPSHSPHNSIYHWSIYARSTLIGMKI